MIAKAYMNYGMSRQQVLAITGLTKHQLYHAPKGVKPGKRPTLTTKWKDHSSQLILERPNEELVEAIIKILLNPDLPNWSKVQRLE